MSLDAALQRPLNFSLISPDEQWAIDKRLGILDWDPSPDEMLEYLRRRSLQGDAVSAQAYPRAWAEHRLNGIEARPEMYASTLISLEEVYWSFLEAVYMLNPSGDPICREARQRASAHYFGYGNASLTQGLMAMDFPGLVLRLQELRRQAHVVAFVGSQLKS